MICRPAAEKGLPSPNLNHEPERHQRAKNDAYHACNRSSRGCPFLFSRWEAERRAHHDNATRPPFVFLLGFLSVCWWRARLVATCRATAHSSRECVVKSNSGKKNGMEWNSWKWLSGSATSHLLSANGMDVPSVCAAETSKLLYWSSTDYSSRNRHGKNITRHFNLRGET